ncbi:PilN domain-containing protein [Serratia rhizosphaerae]|uniref:PilN domain-containing protein n=1 Tax=Serratia rhizosphaerae TaxID=2597702 RepID=A0ABX6GMK3_9GAMM|nr:PilN domain-containing protein [Serratia rhizosphaerae]MEB6337302.1 PilN domain-containing protein [Serratia rhizosphaerae]QHA87497.1 PilN domain-containing protein [Serratia rhizosphaerae]
MYQVNLLPWRQQAQRRRARLWLRLLTLQLVLALTIAAVMLAGVRHRQQQQRSLLLQYTQRYEALQQQYRLIQTATGELARLSARQAQHRRNQSHNLQYARFLPQLAAALPASVWLLSLETQAHTLRLRGLSQGYPALVQLTHRLTTQALLPDHRLTDVAQRSDGLFSFTLTAPWGRDE